MRKSLILLILVSIGLTAPALAKSHSGERSDRNEYKRSENVEKGYRNDQSHRKYAKHDRQDRKYAKHDRRDGKYGHFQKRMKKLRKELRHERRDNRRHVNRDIRRTRKMAGYYDNHQYRRAPVVVAPRRYANSIFSPSLVLRIPLNW